MFTLSCNRLILLLLPLLFLLSGCFSIPETGRKSINLVPESELIKASSSSFEVLKQNNPVSDNIIYNAMLERVGKRILAVSNPEANPADWDFVVFDNDDVVNAFAMPGGKIGVYTGMFRKVIRGDADLAVIVGHEVAHINAKHGNERLSQDVLVQLGALGLGLLTKNEEETLRDTILQAYDAGTSIGLSLPFSRLHESEADAIGLKYTARAGYDPQTAIDLWERMAALDPNSPLEFFSTHPSADTRIQRLRELMPEATAEYEKARGL